MKKNWEVRDEERIILDIDGGNSDYGWFLAAYPKGVEVGRTHKYPTPMPDEVRVYKFDPDLNWSLLNDPTAVSIVTECIRSEYLDPAIDYLIEKGMPDWATELLRSVS